MLAAIASPSSATKTQPSTHTSTTATTPGNNPRQTKTDSAQLPSNLLVDAQSNSGSASPPPSPSTSAAMRKGMAMSKALAVSEEADAGRQVEEQRRLSPEDGSAESSAIVPVSEQSPPQARPLAIPASQLDVLALVTATSPPMPSRRRWGAAPSHNITPKPAVSHDHSDGSDTVSEDELTLRSHSARIRSRHHAVQLRPLPHAHNEFDADSHGALKFKSAANQHDRYQQQQRLTMSAKPLRFHGPITRTAKPQGLHQNGARVRRSSGETTETDEENQQQQQKLSGHTMTPRGRRFVGYPPPNAAIAASSAAGIAAQSMAPASEPAIHRRTRRHRLHENARGVVLSKQLSELTEETEGNDGIGGAHGEPSRSPESSLSLSSSPSASPSRQQRMRTKRLRARKRVQQSGSETETDVEMASRLPGSETETDPSLSNGTSTPSAGSGSANGAALAGGAATFTDARNGTHRRLVGRSSSTVNRLPPFAGDRASKDGTAPSTGSRPMLPPIAQLDRYIRPRHQGERDRADALEDRDGGNSSGGETTETDEEFFGPSRAFHSSIRPSKRVVRHLASLRAQQSHPPAALQLGARPRPPHPSRRHLDAHDRAYSIQPEAPQPISSGSSNGGGGYGPHYSIDGQSYTAPVSATDPSGNGGFGLGIGSLDGDYEHRGTGVAVSQTRVVSTPESVAIPSMSSAIRGTPRPAPRDAASGYAAARSDHIGGRPVRANSGASSSSHNSSMRREFARDPFAPVANEFTYHGAALRRLEKSYVRGSALANGNGPPSSSSAAAAAAAAAANRKRALTAPSSYDPPGFASGRGGLGRYAHSGVGISGRAISSSEAFFDDDHDASQRGRANRSLASSNAGTPPEWNQPLDARIHPLGVSPVSSLRSSLLSHQHRAFPQPPLSSANSPTVSTTNAHHQAVAAKATAAIEPAHGGESGTFAVAPEEEEEDLHERPVSPSMDAVLRQSRKRQHSSGAITLPFSDSSPLSQSNKNSDDTRSPSSKRRAHVEDKEEPSHKTAPSSASPKPNDVVFPPIGPDSPQS
ncbi:hypothetical protein EV179_002105 [Coemansia sp. RSA 487]|nr:hypothetical protein EV179_002105 [Coemansia sp. RSA 487]